MSGPQTFAKKQLRFTFTLSNNAKFSGANNTLVITGLRAAVKMSFPPPPAFPTVAGRVYGMLQSDMNALTALTQLVLTTQRNSVVIEANSGAGWSAIFAGQLVTTLPDYSDLPNVCLRFVALTLGFDAINPATPTSYAPSADVATVIAAICQKLSPACALVNTGVSQTFSGSTYFPGTAKQQLAAACKKAGIAVYTDQPGVVEITPSGSPRNRPLFVLSPQTGLVGYPSFEDINIVNAQCVFNPALVYGGQAKIQGSQQLSNNPQYNVNGTWQIINIDHDLATGLPDGPWFSTMRLQPLPGFKYGQ
jgi:hypothetical protein